MASRWEILVSAAVRSNSWAASMTWSHLPWLTIDDSAFCEGGVGMLSLASRVNRREGSGRRAAGVRDLGRKRGSFSPWMVWYS